MAWALDVATTVLMVAAFAEEREVASASVEALAAPCPAPYHAWVADHPDRDEVLDLLARLRTSPLGERLILAGSSGLYGASEELPALTEDVDVLVDADWVGGHEGELLAELGALGFEHQPGTCTFLSTDGLAVDLVGYSRSDRTDRIGGGPRVRVMVYADLSRLLASAGSTIELPRGGKTLSPAALAAAKLLTVRLEKGSKDKVQALLLIAERRATPGFLAELEGLLRGFEPDRVDDALSDAQAAALALSGDALLAEPQARGYRDLQAQVLRGLDCLRALLGEREGAR